MVGTKVGTQEKTFYQNTNQLVSVLAGHYKIPNICDFNLPLLIQVQIIQKQQTVCYMYLFLI